MNLDNYNYYTDRRVISSMCTPAYEVTEAGPSSARVELTECVLECLIEDEVLPEGHDGVFVVQTRFEVCDGCSGSGKVVDPSIDAGGLTRDDLYDDYDFADDYFGGTYDVTCPDCRGKRVTPAFTLPKGVEEAVDDWIYDDYRFARACAMERAMGA